MTWSTTDHGTGLTIVGDTVTSTAAPDTLGRATTSTLAKKYFEFTATDNASMFVGFASATALTNAILGVGGRTDSIGVRGTLGLRFAGTDTSDGTFAAGDRIGVAFDESAMAFWWKNITTGSAWHPSGDPNTGTGGFTAASNASFNAGAFPPPYFPAYSFSASGPSATGYFSAAAGFLGAIPTGFSPINDDTWAWWGGGVWSVQNPLAQVAAIGVAAALVPDPAGKLTGVAATGAAAALTPQVAAPLSGVAATGAAAAVSLSISTSVTLTGVAASGAARALTPSVAVTQAGVAATGVAAAVVPSVAAPLAQVAGTGTARALTVQVAAPVAGVSAAGTAAPVVPQVAAVLAASAATGVAAPLTPSIAPTLSGVAAAGTARALTPQVAVGVLPVAAVGVAGQVSVPGHTDAAVTGVAATGAVAALVPSVAKVLTGQAAAGQAAAVATATTGPQVPLVGVAAVGVASAVVTQQQVALVGVSATGVVTAPAIEGRTTLFGVSATGAAATLGISARSSNATVFAALRPRSRIAVARERQTIATVRARLRIATARERKTIATAHPRTRIVTFVPNRHMSQASDLEPPIDAVAEEETIGFDFGPALASGVRITGTPTITAEVAAQSQAQDAEPQSRVLGDPTIVTSKKTAAPLAQVNVLFGNAVAGVTYVIQCVAVTSDGQTLSDWVRWQCVAPS